MELKIHVQGRTLEVSVAHTTAKSVFTEVYFESFLDYSKQSDHLEYSCSPDLFFFFKFTVQCTQLVYL